MADIALVTPLRDGMNLIAKEYIATKTDGKGVLILSETAGAARELGEAIVVNINNQEEMVQALEEALAMPEEEQIERNRTMQKRLQRYNINRWAEEFIDRPADLMISNIHYAVVKKLVQSEAFLSHRWFILSGLLRSQAKDVVDRLERLPVKIVNRWDRNGIWHTFLGKRCD